MNPEDRTTETGMLGSEAKNPGPGRDTRQTDPDAAPGADDPETTSAMSDDDPDRPGSEATSVAAPGSDGCPCPVDGGEAGVPDHHPDQALLHELEPVAERLLNRHLAMAKECCPRIRALEPRP